VGQAASLVELVEGDDLTAVRDLPLPTRVQGGAASPGMTLLRQARAQVRRESRAEAHGAWRQRHSGDVEEVEMVPRSHRELPPLPGPPALARLDAWDEGGVGQEANPGKLEL